MHCAFMPTCALSILYIYRCLRDISIDIYRYLKYVCAIIDISRILIKYSDVTREYFLQYRYQVFFT